MKSRYFTIGFSYSAKDNTSGDGDLNFECSDKFFNRKLVRDEIIKLVESKYNIEINHATILSIHEFKNKKDYESYTKD